jgi:hypothetical protein
VADGGILDDAYDVAVTAMRVNMLMRVNAPVNMRMLPAIPVLPVSGIKVALINSMPRVLAHVARRTAYDFDPRNIAHDASTFRRRHIETKLGEAEFPQLRLDTSGVRPKAQQRAEQHIRTDSGGTVKMDSLIHTISSAAQRRNDKSQRDKSTVSLFYFTPIIIDA